MIEQKDASKSDERRVKNTPYSVTQKLKGETDTMGNRGMNNWKLGAFFIIGLMLFAAVFSNTAMAAENDGKGRVTVGWNSRALATDMPLPVTDATAANVSSSTDPIAAGSARNVLQFTYTAIDNVRGTTAADAIDTTAAADADLTMADENDKPINMAGGRIRIALPSGWKASNKFLRVHDADQGATLGPTTMIYSTIGDGTATEVEDHEGRVSFTEDKYITVKLDAKWSPAERRSDNIPGIGRQLIIILGDVTSGIPRSLDKTDTKDSNTVGDHVPYAEDTFQASSSAKNGTLLRLLAGSPAVRVGNILGDKTKQLGTDGVVDGSDADTDYVGRDTLERKVTITPKHVFQGEKDHKFTVSFTAPGPMYGAVLRVPIPAGLRPTAVGTLSKSSGVTAGFTAIDNAVNLISIDLTKINVGQRVSVSYTVPLIGDTDGNGVLSDVDSAVSDFVLADSLQNLEGDVTTDMPGEGVLSDPAEMRVTTLEGGKASALPGSGSVALEPSAAEAGSQRRTITVTYTAHANLRGTDIEITTAGIVIGALADTTQKLQMEDSNDYGYVTGSLSDNLSIEAKKTIKWTNIDLDKNKTLTAKIQRVDIIPEVGEQPWTVRVGPALVAPADPDLFELMDNGDIDGDELPVFSVVNTSGDAVKFEIDGPDTFPAGSLATIMFKFTAESTAIRNGRVSLTIPSALGSAPTITKKVNGRVQAKISSGDLEKDQGDKPGVSGRTINVGIKRLDVGETVTVIYGRADDDGKEAVLSDVSGDIKVTGTFRTSSTGSTRTAGTVTVMIGNIADGTGLAVLSPTSVEAGSNHRAIEVTFTAAGTMDGGMVSLEIPTGWGAMQNDPTKRNYVTTRGSGVDSLDVGSRRVIATIDELAKGESFRFIYGGGTAGASNGVEVQDSVEIAEFTIKSDGDGDDVFKQVAAPADDPGKHKGREKIRNPDALGKIYSESDDPDIMVGAGILRIKVTSALDGTGTATVDVTEVRAAADDVVLVFEYTPSQTIEEGELKFTVPSSWSKPQVEEIGEPGYTEVDGVGLGTATDNDKFSVTIPIFSLDKANAIKITYGATDTGRAMASTVVGTAAFKIEMKGHANGNLTPLREQPPAVKVGPQASGKGKAVLAVTGDDLHAGDMDREITVTYTSAGQVVAGKVRLTIPAKWSAPTAENVTVMSDMTAMTPMLDVQMVIADGVNLMAGGQVKFTYTGDVQSTTGTDIKFAVAVNGGEVGDTFGDVSGDDTMLTVDVGQARAGSGMGMVSPRIVQAGATGVNIQFTYTAVGWIDAPREFRMQVPAGWTAPSNAGSSIDNKGTYTVVHRSGGAETMTSIEKLDPIGRDLVARVRQGGLEVEGDDEIIFTYQNADAPAMPEISNFVLIFDGKPIADSVQVRVQDSMPSQLSLSSAGTVSAAADAMPLGITVGLQDDDGDAVAQNSDVMVTLTSTSAGTFSMMAGEAGTESITVTIAGGDVSTMVYYMDSTAGTAIITASAPNLDPASQEVMVEAAPTAPVDPPVDPEVELVVDPDVEPVVAITEGSIMVSPALAMADGMVTVSAMGTAGQMATFSVGSIVTDGSMTEDEAGSYSGSFSVVVDQHADGMYGVSVTLNADATTTMMVADALTIDSTDPTVTVTVPESAANGDMVMISAMVTDAGMISSVTADVSMLDSTQTAPVALAMGEDGAYSATVPISGENENANGSKTITVTAMDAAGNSGMGTATVELANTLSYTSMIPAGISLFHVPLDVEGLDTVGDLKGMIGNGSNLAIVYDHATGSWNSRSDDVAITADLGIVLSMGSAATYTFEGEAWDGGASMISLQVGSNLIGLPVNDPRVTNASDIAGLFAEGVVSSIVISTDDGFKLVSDTVDAAVMGDAAYLVTASAAGTATLLGDGWTYSDMAGAAPIALAGFSVEGQTPVLDVNGSIVDEITGLAREGFRVKVKNLSTKASLNRVTSLEVEAGGYNMTFVDLKSGNAARIGDVLEISADSPSPLIGVQPVRHIVTADDVKSGILELEDLIAYEIPAETELLRNYPNPFNPETWIPYRLAEDADVSLTIYDVNGELVRSIDVGHQSAAVYESRAKAIYWDGRNRFGEQVASGIYFYSLSTSDFSATRKMVILK